MRIIQLSDTHLSARYDYFKADNEIIASSLSEQTPDLFIHSGDLSMDGALQPEDLELARQWNDKLQAEVLSIPGNHDVGDLASIRPDQPLNDARLATWADTIGPDRWARVASGWQLIGLNAMLFGTGHSEEEEQFRWLASVLNRSRPIAIFTHKPMCVEDPQEGARGYWTIAPQPRARLLGLLDGMPVKLVASGHLHIERQQVINGLTHVWSPASSFVVGATQEDLGGERRLGYVEHVFGEDDVSSRFIHPDGLANLQLDPYRDEIYPALTTDQ